MQGHGNHQEDEQPVVDHVNLKVKGQDGTEVFFKVQKRVQLKKLMRIYCERQRLVFREIAFLYNGARIMGNQTPKQLKMEDEDEIDAMKHHGGGAKEEMGSENREIFSDES